MSNLYAERYDKDVYYWGLKPSSNCVRVLELVPPDRPVTLLDVGCGGDPNHGKRAAEFIKTLNGKYIHLDDQKLKLLYEACENHTKGRTKADITVMTCWDADRLDLWRVGIRPNPKFLCTEYAKKKNIIEKCCQNIKKAKRKN